MSLYVYYGLLNMYEWKKKHIDFGKEMRISGLIWGLHPANERRRYKVTPSLIGWAQT